MFLLNFLQDTPPEERPDSPKDHSIFGLIDDMKMADSSGACATAEMLARHKEFRSLLLLQNESGDYLLHYAAKVGMESITSSTKHFFTELCWNAMQHGHDFRLENRAEQTVYEVIQADPLYGTEHFRDYNPIREAAIYFPLEKPCLFHACHALELMFRHVTDPAVFPAGLNAMRNYMLEQVYHHNMAFLSDRFKYYIRIAQAHMSEADSDESSSAHQLYRLIAEMNLENDNDVEERGEAIMDLIIAFNESHPDSFPRITIDRDENAIFVGPITAISASSRATLKISSRV